MPEPENKTKSTGQEHKNWSSRSLGTKWQHRFFYNMLKLFGIKPARIALLFVVAAYCLRPSIYRRSLFYLEHRFKHASFLARFVQVCRLYWQFGQVLLERAATGILGNVQIDISEKDKKCVQALIAKGKGVIFLNAHVGYWQMALSALSFDVPVNLVHPRSTEDVDRHFFEHSKNKNFPKINIINPNIFKDSHSVLISMSAALLRGELLCIMGDRITETDRINVSAHFLGGEILLPGSVYLLAAKTGAPIVITFSYRTGVCKAHNYIFRILELPQKLPKQAESIAPYAQELANGMEDFCQKHPFQFFNFHNIWLPTIKG